MIGGVGGVALIAAGVRCDADDTPFGGGVGEQRFVRAARLRRRLRICRAANLICAIGCSAPFAARSHTAPPIAESARTLWSSTVR